MRRRQGAPVTATAHPLENGEALQEARDRADLSRVELAHILDVSPYTVVSWEKGRRRVPRVVALAVQAVLEQRQGTPPTITVDLTGASV